MGPSAGRVLGKFAAAATAGGAALVATAQTAHTDGDILHPVTYPWSHTGAMAGYDTASIRRGHQVYAEVCAACHGLKRIAYRNLVGVCYTEDEAKEMALDKEYLDGPDDTGELSHVRLHSSALCMLTATHTPAVLSLPSWRAWIDGSHSSQQARSPGIMPVTDGALAGVSRVRPCASAMQVPGVHCRASVLSLSSHAVVERLWQSLG